MMAPIFGEPRPPFEFGGGLGVDVMVVSEPSELVIVEIVGDAYGEMVVYL
jgi:hypothetical protein